MPVEESVTGAVAVMLPLVSAQNTGVDAVAVLKGPPGMMRDAPLGLLLLGARGLWGERAGEKEKAQRHPQEIRFVHGVHTSSSPCESSALKA